MKKMSPKMLVVLILAFFVVVGLLAAITALASKEKKPATPTQFTEVNRVDENQVTNEPVVTTNNNTNNQVTNEVPDGPRGEGTGFDDYDGLNVDLESYIEDEEITSITAYSAAGMNMEEAKDDIDFENLYKTELSSSEVKDLVKEFTKAFKSEKRTTYDLGDELEGLYARKIIVLNDDVYFGINEEYAYARNKSDLEVFEITNSLKKFALDIPQDVDADFNSFKLSLGDLDYDINFDDPGEIRQIKENFYSYEIDEKLASYEFVGYMEFENGNRLDIYEDDGIYMGEYQSGRDVNTVMLNNESIGKILDIVNEALGR